MASLDRVLRRTALRVMLAAFVIAPGSAALAAQAAGCAQWNVAGKHALIQSNMPGGPQMTLQQDGTQFKGSIYYNYTHNDDSYVQWGDIVGTVVGSRFEATVYWWDNKVGIYAGDIGAQGLVVGRTFNKSNPAESADFHGSPAFDCLTTSAPSAPANNGNTAGSGKPAIALGRVNLQPTIVEPQKGGAYAPQTPLRIRLAAAKGARDTAYRIEIQRQKITHSPGSSGFDIEWSNVATIDTTADVAQSAAGLLDWGGSAGRKDMVATGGIYRVRATAMAPQGGAPTDWVQFKINGPSGGDDAMNQAKTGSQGHAPSAASRMTGQPSKPDAQAKAPAALSAQTLTPKTLTGAATLNTQATAPKTSLPALAAKPLAGAARNTDAVTSNPQALPPGGLQQAPSSLR